MSTTRTLALLALLLTELLTFGPPWALAQESGASPKADATVPPGKVASPPQPGSPLRHALELYRNGRLEEARAEYEGLTKAGGSGSAAAYAGLARVLLKQKNLEEAAAAAKEAMDADGNSGAAHTALGEVYFRQGKIVEAEHEFLPLAKEETAEPRAHYGLARVYFASSFYFHAKVQIDIAHQLDPEDPEIQKLWMSTLNFKERLAAMRGYLEGEREPSDDEREHMESALASMEEADESGRKGCRLVGAPKNLDMRLETLLRDSRHLRGVGLRVELNGSSSTLLLDTGAGGILVDKKVAEKAGIKPITKSDFHGIGDKGPVGGYVGIADSIKIGDIEFTGCHVSVVAERSVAEGDGLIGANVFGAFLVDIDIPDYRFRLSPLPARPAPGADHLALEKRFPGSARFHDRYVAPEMKGFTPFFRFGHQMLIPTRVNDLPPGLFLVDTGAFSNTITPAAAKEATKVHADSNMRVKGLNGSVKEVFTADDLTLTFSHYAQRTRDMVAFDTKGISDGTGTEVSGILGLAMLRMMDIKIDYRDGLIDFGYDAKRWH
jgi:tetratricopeptide (TPR) repeat protein/predicted aspartyl protease